MKWMNVFIIVSLAVVTSAIVAAYSGNKNMAESDFWLETKEHHASMHGDDFEEHHRQMHGDDWEEHVKDCHSGDSEAMPGS